MLRGGLSEQGALIVLPAAKTYPSAEHVAERQSQKRKQNGWKGKLQAFSCSPFPNAEAAYKTARRNDIHGVPCGWGVGEALMGTPVLCPFCLKRVTVMPVSEGTERGSPGDP